MPTSTRKSIIDNVVSTLQGVTTANGYKTNLGDNVLNLSTSPMVANDIAGAAIKEGEISFEPGALGLADGHFGEMELMIDTFTKGATAKDDIDNNLQDIVSAMGVDRQRGGYALNTELMKMQVDSEPTETQTVTATLNFTIYFSQYRFDLTQ